VNLAMIAAMSASPGPVGLPVSDLAPKQLPRKPPDRPHWDGDGIAPENETRQQRRARERKEQSK
jgi:hypothetical protein